MNARTGGGEWGRRGGEFSRGPPDISNFLAFGQVRCVFMAEERILALLI